MIANLCLECLLQGARPIGGELTLPSHVVQNDTVQNVDKDSGAHACA